MRLAFAAFTTLLAGCALPDAEAPWDDPEPEPQPEPEPLACEGAYQVDSVLDVQAAAVLPQTAYDAVETLRGLRDNPGETLFDLAEEAGVPAVGEIRDALPSYLEDRLYGWIDGELAGYTNGDTPVAVVIDRILTIAETVIAELRLSSELTIEDGRAVHRLRAIAFAFEAYEAGFDLDLQDDATVSRDGDSLTLGSHAFGLAYGELALAALDAILQAELGTDLRGALGLLADCPTLAHAIASKCYLGVCVGHEAQLAAVCEGGLDYLAGQIQARVGSLRFDAITLQAGTATTTADGLADGVWTATLDAGMGPRTAPGTFAATCL